jgi:hypothetical protein
LKKEDEEKTAFITPYDIFCYQVMLFGLKNYRGDDYLGRPRAEPSAG